MIKTCKHCGKEYEGKAKQTYCSRDCQRRSKRSTEWDHTCVNCGKTFTRPKRNRDSCQFCSRDCAFEYQAMGSRHRRRVKRIKRCDKCAKIFLRRGHYVRYCSDACRYAFYLNNRQELRCQGFVPQKKICRNCGEEFMTEFKKSRVFCSDDCSVRYAKERKKTRDRHRLDGIIIDDDITLAKLYSRDNGICQLCGLPTDWDDYQINDDGYRVTGRNYPSIDHICPISRGGLHSWENVQLAHHYCNGIKSDSKGWAM